MNSEESTFYGDICNIARVLPNLTPVTVYNELKSLKEDPERVQIILRKYFTSYEPEKHNCLSDDIKNIKRVLPDYPFIHINNDLLAVENKENRVQLVLKKHFDNQTKAPKRLLSLDNIDLNGESSGKKLKHNEDTVDPHTEINSEKVSNSTEKEHSSNETESYTRASEEFPLENLSEKDVILINDLIQEDEIISDSTKKEYSSNETESYNLASEEFLPMNSPDQEMIQIKQNDQIPNIPKENNDLYEKTSKTNGNSNQNTYNKADTSLLSILIDMFPNHSPDLFNSICEDLGVDISVEPNDSVVDLVVNYLLNYECDNPIPVKTTKEVEIVGVCSVPEREYQNSVISCSATSGEGSTENWVVDELDNYFRETAVNSKISDADQSYNAIETYSINKDLQTDTEQSQKALEDSISNISNCMIPDNNFAINKIPEYPYVSPVEVLYPPETNQVIAESTSHYNNNSFPSDSVYSDLNKTNSTISVPSTSANNVELFIPKTFENLVSSSTLSDAILLTDSFEKIRNDLQNANQVQSDVLETIGNSNILNIQNALMNNAFTNPNTELNMATTSKSEKFSGVVTSRPNSIIKPASFHLKPHTITTSNFPSRQSTIVKDRKSAARTSSPIVKAASFFPHFNATSSSGTNRKIVARPLCPILKAGSFHPHTNVTSSAGTSNQIIPSTGIYLAVNAKTSTFSIKSHQTITHPGPSSSNTISTLHKNVLSNSNPNILVTKNKPNLKTAAETNSKNLIIPGQKLRPNSNSNPYLASTKSETNSKSVVTAIQRKSTKTNDVSTIPAKSFITSTKTKDSLTKQPTKTITNPVSSTVLKTKNTINTTANPIPSTSQRVKDKRTKTMDAKKKSKNNCICENCKEQLTQRSTKTATITEPGLGVQATITNKTKDKHLTTISKSRTSSNRTDTQTNPVPGSSSKTKKPTIKTCNTKNIPDVNTYLDVVIGENQQNFVQGLNKKLSKITNQPLPSTSGIKNTTQHSTKTIATITEPGLGVRATITNKTKDKHLTTITKSRTSSNRTDTQTNPVPGSSSKTKKPTIKTCNTENMSNVNTYLDIVFGENQQNFVQGLNKKLSKITNQPLPSTSGIKNTNNQQDINKNTIRVRSDLYDSYFDGPVLQSPQQSIEINSNDSQDNDDLILVSVDRIQPTVDLTANFQPVKLEKTEEEPEAINKEINQPLIVKENHPFYFKLMEIFPDICPDYLRKLCSENSETRTMDDLVSFLLNGDYIRRNRPASPQSTLNFEEQNKILQDLFPDADPTYLQHHCERLIDQPEDFKHFVATLLETKNYPTKAEYLKKMKLSAQEKQYTTEFDVKKFLEVIPNPEEFFNDPKRQISFSNFDDTNYAVTFLKNTFCTTAIKDITSMFKKCNFCIIRTANALEKFHNLKTRRKPYPVTSCKNIPLLQEIAYVKHKKEILAYIELQEVEKKQARERAKAEGLMTTCQCCFDDEVMPEDTATCESGKHIFCKNCVKRGCEVLIGDGKLEFPCLETCDSFFSLQVLQAVLTPKVFSKMAQRRQMEEIKSAGIEDLEFCPFCDFATIPAPGDKVFRCLNTDCMKESCRLCKEPSHIPLRCDEVEKDKDVKIRTYIEDKMTEALLRKCWKCGLKFIKESGCNKMTCSCGAMMCYVCNKPVKDYKHFNGQGGDQLHLCPLYSDTNKMHVDEIKRSAESAKKELGVGKKNQLKIDPTVDLEQHYHRLAAQNPAVPNIAVMFPLPNQILPP